MIIYYKCDKCNNKWYDKFTRFMFDWGLYFLCRCSKCGRSVTEYRRYRC